MIHVDLPELLLRQKDHDERFCQDLAWLSPDVRAKHYVLHFTKYLARLVEIRRAYNDVYWNKTVADIMIVALSAAHAWNINGSMIETAVLDTHVRDKRQTYLEQRKAVSLALIPWFQEELALMTGSMAKACEQLDHGETGEYMQVLKINILHILILLLAVSQLLEIDLVHLVEGRWQAMKSDI